MDEQQFIKTDYDDQGDILTFSFTKSPQPAIAEEAADDVWVRFDPQTNKVITVDVLNFSSGLTSIFGQTMKYKERTDPELLNNIALSGLTQKV